MEPNKNIEVFIVYVLSLDLRLNILIYLNRETQIVLLLNKKVKILAKYSDFFNILSKKKTLELLKLTKLN